MKRFGVTDGHTSSLSIVTSKVELCVRESIFFSLFVISVSLEILLCSHRPFRTKANYKRLDQEMYLQERKAKLTNFLSSAAARVLF